MDVLSDVSLTSIVGLSLFSISFMSSYFSVFTGYGEYYAAGPAEDDMAYHIMAHYQFSIHCPLTLIDQFFFLSTQRAFHIIVFAYFQFYLPNLNRNQREIDLRTR